MTSLAPRDPYTPEELRELYPEGLKLQLVQAVSVMPLLLWCFHQNVYIHVYDFCTLPPPNFAHF